MKNTYDILAAGSLMVDILAADLSNISEPSKLTYATTDFMEKIGGHPVDVVIDLAKLGINPKKLAIIGVVGGNKDDFFANYILSTIKKYGITTKFIKKIPNKRTGKNIVLEVKGEDRRFHISPGANRKLNPQDIIEFLRRYKPKIFSARPCYTGMDKCMKEIFRTAGSETLKIIDICKPYKIRWDEILPALEYVDIFHGNEHETKGITGKKNLDDSIKSLLDKGLELIFITRGNEGKAELCTCEGTIIKQMPFDAKSYVPEREALDATGCGDAFCA
ncbi:MAG: carbohydrate kinase family protein, partial [Candidatus Hodarchaeota archaeon]